MNQIIITIGIIDKYIILTIHSKVCIILKQSHTVCLNRNYLIRTIKKIVILHKVIKILQITIKMPNIYSLIRYK